MMLRALLATCSLGLLASPLCADDTFGQLPQPVAAGHSLKALRSVDGNLVGQVHEVFENSSPAPAKEGTVLVAQNGQKVAEVRLGPEGVFQIPGLSDGKYSFIFQAPAGFATFGQFVSGGSTQQHTVGVIADLVPPTDLPFVRDVLMSTPTSGVAAAGGQVVPRDVLAGIQSHGAFSVNDGGLVRGYLLIPEATQVRAADHMTVWFVQGGRPVASGQTNGMGLFEVNGLKAGWYTLVASGPVGFMSASVEVVRSEGPTVQLPHNGVATQAVWADGGATGVAPSSPADLALIRNNLPQDPNGAGAPAPVPPVGDQAAGGGLGSGGGFGGGGGGGGGGLLGALLGAGLGAGIGAAIAANNDDKVVIVSPPGP